MIDLGYFSGQGRVCLAKIDRRTGEHGEFFTCNAPRFDAHFGGLQEGTLFLEMEGFGSEALDMFFGGESFKTNTNQFSEIHAEDIKNTFPNRIATGTKITRRKKQHYYLVFEGFNTANENNPLRIELQDVHFHGVDKFEFINNEGLTSFAFDGQFLTDMDGSYGFAYNIDPASEALMNFVKSKEHTKIGKMREKRTRKRVNKK